MTFCTVIFDRIRIRKIDQTQPVTLPDFFRNFLFNVEFFFKTKYFSHSLDVNECERFSPCGATNKCDNLIGSYVCTCGAGYRASPDARACVDEGRFLVIIFSSVENYKHWTCQQKCRQYFDVALFIHAIKLKFCRLITHSISRYRNFIQYTT